MDLAAETASWPVGSLGVAVLTSAGVTALLDDGAVQPWASVSKLAASLAVLDVVAEGLACLDDEVGPPGSTLRHLLSHSSGLAFDDLRALSPPGRRRIYSNTGIQLAAEHSAARANTPFEQLLAERVLEPLEMHDTELAGSPSHGMRGPLTDLAKLAAELLSPRVYPTERIAAAIVPTFPDLDGVLPGFGRQSPNEFGLGFEVRGTKHPHWTSPSNSPQTFGHFGQSGCFLWVDPQARLACVSICDTPFGPWAAQRWPLLSTHVLQSVPRNGA